MTFRKSNPPRWLNYHHLLYFWAVAREGSIVAASEELGVSQPSISLQVKDLERALGRKLFERVGRRLVLTDAGRVVYGYAGEIFALGRQLMDAVDRQPAGRALRLAVGITDAIPKTLARVLLEPALALSQPVRLVCREDKVDRLLMDLAARRLDMVLSDAPIGSGVHLRGFNHLLGECGVTFFAAPALAAKLRRGFPKSLDGMPLLLPTDNTALRRSLDLWFDARRVAPRVEAEFEDAAMMYSFGQSGLGAFPAPSVVREEVHRQWGVRVIGKTEAVTERFYAISTEQKLQHPGVVAVRETARRETFQ
jgi:LysR family transcriptional regulator, transcriptional activator of nhaA